MLASSLRIVRAPARPAKSLSVNAAALAALILLVAPQARAAEALPTAPGRDVTAASRAVVREQPRPLSPVLAIVPAGGIVFAQGEADGWVRVTTREGATGFVPGTLAASSLNADERRALGDGTLPTTLVVASRTELHLSPALGSRVTGVVPEGGEIHVGSRLGDWASVTSERGQGWLDLVGSPVASSVAESRQPAPAVAAAAPPQEGEDDAAVRERLRQQREQLSRERQARQQAQRDEHPARETEPRPAPAPAGSEEAAQRRADREAAAAARQHAAEQARAEREAAKTQAPAPTPAAPTAPTAEERAAKREADAAARKQEADAARAQREADAAARKQDAEAARAQREAEAAAKKKEAEEAKAQRDAETASKAKPEPSQERVQKEADATRAQREADAAARKQEADAARAQREAEAAAKKKEAEEAKAERESELAAKPKPDADAVRARREADAAAKKQADEDAKAQRAADAAAKKQADEDAKAQRAADAAAKKQADDEARAQREAAGGAKKQAEDADKAARDARAQRDREEIERARQEAEAAKARGPAQPVDIPPPVAVTLDAKAPNERKRDPSANPLVRQGVPTLAPSTPPAPKPLPGGGETFDEQQQLARSVASLHEDRQQALGLSTGDSRPDEATPTASTYIGEDAKPVSTSVVSQIVVRVNDAILTSGEFERLVTEAKDEMKRRSGSDATPAEDREIRRRMLTRMIEQLVLLEEGKTLGVSFDKVYDGAKQRFMKQAGIKDDLELVQLLDATGRSWDDFRRDLLRESVPPIVLKSQVYNGITVSEDDIQAHYRLHQEEWAEEGCVKIREIVLQPEPKERTKDFNARLETLLKSLESGADFCEMARRYSKAPSADDCGLLPTCFTRSQLDEKVALVAFRMKPGDVEPITTDWGYHVIRLEELKPRRIRPLSEVRDQIVDRLKAERGTEEMRRYIDRLRESAKIDVAPEYRALLESTARAGSAGQ